MEQDQLLFLLSQPRSGSTLLQRILGNHPVIHTRSEPWILLHDLYTKGIRADYNYEWYREAFHDFCTDLPDGFYNAALRDFYLTLYGGSLAQSGKRFFLDKTPRYYMIVREIQALFPRSKCIVLIRNPLSVLYSILETWIRGEWGKLADYKHDLTTAVDVMERLILQDNNCHIVRYERLLAEPEPVISALCARIGIEYDPAMLELEKSDISSWHFGDPVNARVKQSIDASHVEGWIGKKGDAQTWALMHDYLQWIGRRRYAAFGYDFDAMSKVLEVKRLETQECSHTILYGLESLLFGETVGLHERRASQWLNRLGSLIDTRMLEHPRFIVYGAGNVGALIYAKYPDAVAAFLDRNPDCGVVSAKVPIVAPERIGDLETLPILISVFNQTEKIKRYLIDELQIDSSRIYVLDVGGID